ncbi:MAG: hypothetical protein II866_14445 [Prevotella sp.]|nr:hypothetical protein [Prevotella sp.]
MLDFNQDSAKTVVRRKYEDSIGKTRLDRVKSVSTTERVMASTMSVDEYFDELISQVHEDYADL